MDKKVKSEHVFIFPFTWKVDSKKNKYLFVQHMQIKDKVFDTLKNWQASYISIEEDKTYNEFVYFYKPVRAALYSMKNAPLIVRNYVFKNLDNDNYFIIKVENKEYVLYIEDIHLKVYKTGVAILTMEMSNFDYEEMEDIERINSFSKCIYPPILPLEKAKEDLFPDFVKIKLSSHHKIEENFKKDYHKEAIGITPLILGLLGEPFVCKEEKVHNGSIFIEPLLGNQMFALCLYKNKQLVEGVHHGQADYKRLEAFMTNNRKIIYASEDHIAGHVGSIYYLKTENSIYGISRFALLCIVKEIPKIKLYDQLITLVIMQRATLLNLSTEIARVSTLSPYELVPAIQSIYEIYIQFVNQLYFKEVTEEAQGSEIYEKLSKQLKIEEELNQLDFEIEEVHEYAMLIEQAQSKFKVDLLTIVGAALVLPTFATGFFGMNIFKEEIVTWWMNRNVALWINSYVFLPILVTIGLCTWNRQKSRFHLIKKIVLMSIFALSIIVLIKYGCGL